MAADDESLLINEGQSWALWADDVGFASPNSNCDINELKVNDDDRSSMCLDRTNMAIYGYCPRWENFYLVVCDLCGKALKPQVLQQHLDLRHNDDNDYLKNDDECDSRSSTKSHLRHRYKFDLEIGRDSSISPSESATNDADVLPEESVPLLDVNDQAFTKRSSSSILSNVPQGCEFSPVTDDLVPSLPLLRIKVESLRNSLRSDTQHPARSTSYKIVHSSHMPQLSSDCEPQHVLTPPSSHNGPPPSIGPPSVSMCDGATHKLSTSPSLLDDGSLNFDATSEVSPVTLLNSSPQTSATRLSPSSSPDKALVYSETDSSAVEFGSQASVVDNPKSIGLLNYKDRNSATSSFDSLISLKSQTSSEDSPELCHSQSTANTMITTTISSPLLEQGHMGTGTNQSLHLRHTQSCDETMPFRSPNISRRVSDSSNNNLIGNHSSQASVAPHISSSNHFLREKLSEEKNVRCNFSDHTSEDEVNEVNRISAMLMKEAEALSCQGNDATQNEANYEFKSFVPNRPAVGGQDFTSGDSAVKKSSNPSLTRPSEFSSSFHSSSTTQVLPQNPCSSHSLSSAPVSMSSMSMATLKQIQADLLATVSESDLNAVLNATPETCTFAQNSSGPSSNSFEIGNENVNFINSYNSNTENDGTAELYSVVGDTPEQVVDRASGSQLSSSPSVNRSCSPFYARELPFQNNTTDSKIPVSACDLNPPLSNSQFSSKNSVKYDRDSNWVNSSLPTNKRQDLSIDSHMGLISLLQQPVLNQSINMSSSSPSLNGITVMIGESQGGVASSFPSSIGQNIVNSNFASGSSSFKSNEVCYSSSNVFKEIPPSDTRTTENRTSGDLSLGLDQSVAHPQKVQISFSSQNKLADLKSFGSHPQSTQSQLKIGLRDISHQSPTNSQMNNLQTHSNPSMNTDIRACNPVQRSNSTCSTASLTPSPKKSSKKRKPSERKFLPLKDREYDPEVHCGVVNCETGRQCTRSLTCKTHSLTLRRAVPGRSKKFDELLMEHKSAKDALLKSSKLSDGNAATLMQPRKSSVGGIPNNFSPQISVYAKNLSTTMGPAQHALSQVHGASLEAHSSSYRTPISSDNQDEFSAVEPPRPFAVCDYNARKLGGYLATDHKVDFLRNALVRALKKAPSLLPMGEASHCNFLHQAKNDKGSNSVKSILARKLQSTVPSSYCNEKDAMAPGLAVNLLQTNVKQHNPIESLSVVSNSNLNNSLKRNSHSDLATVQSSHLPANTRTKSKKVKSEEASTPVNYVGNLVQLDNINSRNYPFIAVTLQNGISNPQTVTFGNVPIAGVQNSSNPPLRLHTPVALKETEGGRSLNNSEATTNFVLSSGAGIPSGSIVIADTMKSVKSDLSQGTTIKLDTPKLYSSKITSTVNHPHSPNFGFVSDSSPVLAGSSAPATSESLNSTHPGQVYFTAVSGANNTQFLQQLLNCKIGKSSNLKLLSATQQNSNHRQAFVFHHQERDAPS